MVGFDVDEGSPVEHEYVVKVGVISDTHGLLRPQAIEALQDSDLIIHAGDIGRREVIDGLSEIAETIAIRGNIDKESWAEAFPLTRCIEIAGKSIYLLHDLKEMGFDPAARSIDIIIAGHSHKPRIYEENGVLYVNPGSAGPRRFKLPVSVAQLWLTEGGVEAQLFHLTV